MMLVVLNTGQAVQQKFVMYAFMHYFVYAPMHELVPSCGMCGGKVPVVIYIITT